jgi:hypothetical protein
MVSANHDLVFVRQATEPVIKVFELREVFWFFAEIA